MTRVSDSPATQPPALISIIVPVFNEVNTVGAVLERLLAVPLPAPRQIVIVNDGSTDGTRDVIDRIGGGQAAVTIVHAPRNAGKGSAIRMGLAHATGSVVAIQDADLELDPVQLGGLVQPILRGEATVVYGSRFLAGPTGAPWLTVAANRVLTSATNLMYGARLTDMETCYKVMRADVVRSLSLSARRFDIEPEITARLLRAGHRIMELPVRFQPRLRAAGKKIGWRDGLHAFWVLVKNRL